MGVAWPRRLGLDAALARPFGALLGGVVNAFTEKDLNLIEINPLVVTGDGKLLAADGKIDTDENSHFRHRDLAELRDPDQEDPLERNANDKGVQYVKLDGDVGCMVNGAGLAMATMDVIAQVGHAPPTSWTLAVAAQRSRWRRRSRSSCPIRTSRRC